MRDGEGYRTGDRDERPWGTWEVLATAPNYAVKRIVVKPGAKLSLQRHRHRAEHWVIAEGTARVTLDDRTIELSRQGSVDIPLGAVHRVENTGKRDLVFIELQVGDQLREDDIERLSDDYGRA